MGDDLKQCFDRDRRDRDFCDRKLDCDCTSSSDDCGSDWDLGSWLPILIIIFLLCGGTNILGSSRDDCSDNGFGGGWLLILILLFLFLGNKDGKDGFLGGLFR